jgi:hypothetical protein
LRRRTAALLLLSVLLPAVAVAAGGPARGANARGGPAPPALQTAYALRFPTATPVTPGPTDPQITIVRVDMERRVGGVFASTRDIRVDNIARYIVYFRERNAGALLPRCHIIFLNRGREFDSTVMWRKKGRNQFFVDGRFRNVIGPSQAAFTIYLGRTQDRASLAFTIKLPKV